MLLVVALAVLAPAAAASVQLDTYGEEVVAVVPRVETWANVTIPFHLTEAGRFYAKLLVTPWNPVNDGEPHGEIAPDHAAGVSGWWVSFALVDVNGTPLAADANGEPVPAPLGAYTDSTPTRLLALDASTLYGLVVSVHVPADGMAPGATLRVPVALAFRAVDADASGSGGALDQSRGFTVVLESTGASSLSDEAPGDDGPADEVNGTPPSTRGPEARPTPPELSTGMYGWVLLALAVTAVLLALASLALSIAVFGFVRKRDGSYEVLTSESGEP